MTERRTEVIETREDGPRRVPPWYEEHWWLWALVLLLFVAGLIAFFLLRGGDDDRETVPRVVGLREAQAIERLEDEGFDVRVVREPADEPRGQVFAQTPGAGTQLAEGETVEIEVSGGEAPTETETVTTTTETETQPPPETETAPPETAAVPDAVGQGLVDGVTTILDAGFLASTYPVESAEEGGTIVAQRPPPGTEAERGSEVRLNVALGEGEREAVEVPDLTGPAIEDALRSCAEAGFTCRTLNAAAPSAEEVGEVIDQRPAAGATAPELTQITLFVGR
jgi:beta-lactam-binding protein with PASTA domain